MSNRNYDNNSISALKGADKIRLRPAVIFGSDDIKGCQQTLFEILSNSVDEGKSGYGNIIKLTKHKDLSWTIQDYGRGIPMDWNEKEERYNWDLCLCEMYAGGKYKLGEGEQYEDSIGLNGLGLASSQMSSEFMKVTSNRDGYTYGMEFEKGYAVGELQKEKSNYDKTGTTITYKPDKEVFTDINIPIEWVKSICQEQSVIAKGITFVVYDEENDKEYKYLYENGINDYIKELSCEKEISSYIEITGNGKGKDTEDRPEYSAKFSLVMCFNNEYPQQKYFHNSSNLEYGGSPQKAVRNGVTSCIDSYLKDKGKYTKGEKGIGYIDVEDSLLSICSSFSTITSYENQTKKAITNKFVQELITQNIKEQLNIFLIENPIEAEKISMQVLINKRSREKAEKTRINVRKQLSGNVSGLSRKIEGLKDCDMRHSTLEERIFIVDEGLSANSTIIEAFDNRYMGCLGLRGRFINSLKSSVEDVLNNEPAIAMIQALGCGIEIPKDEKKKFKDMDTFDIDKLRYGSVGILCDADSFGKGITLSIITFFYKFMPQLLEQGRIYFVISPRYEVRDKSKQSYYAYHEKERDALIDKLGSKFLDISIRKGLGEFNKDEFWNLVLSPDVRDKTFIKVKYEGNEEEIEAKFNALMGEDIASRKLFIKDKIVNVDLNEID